MDKACNNQHFVLDNILFSLDKYITMVNSKVNRTQLVEALAADAGSSKAQAERFLSSFVDVVTKHLKKGADISITGFGTFKRVRKNARKGVNPKTRQPISIPASNGVSFRVGKTLKEAVK